MTRPDPQSSARPDPRAVRQVSALVTAWVDAAPRQREDDPAVLATLDDALDNAVRCLPILADLVNTLLCDLSDVYGVPASALWQRRALAAAALYDEGGPRG
ncbi:hypothetical protein BU52_09950 [Streptomyces toyocaensis]|uniref:Uncharacterized protein n=1 Tax=Streptomyces toyocaensis TaxID=55952 RepID=A0A081XUU7_STRTO|nr:hypothetical protein [Streptomyces toyocaensis]KES07320.1 hypothetical protein BU52_09950 [Streptomyces toyocaensis]